MTHSKNEQSPKVLLIWALGMQSSAGYGGGSRDVHYHISKARGISSARLLKCVRTRFERALGFEDVKPTQIFCRRIPMASHWLHMAWNWVIIKRDGHSYVRPKIFLYTACTKLIFFYTQGPIFFYIRQAEGQIFFIYGQPELRRAQFFLYTAGRRPNFFLYTASQSYSGLIFFYIRQAESQFFFYIRLARTAQGQNFFYMRPPWCLRANFFDIRWQCIKLQIVRANFGIVHYIFLLFFYIRFFLHTVF